MSFRTEESRAILLEEIREILAGNQDDDILPIIYEEASTNIVFLFPMGEPDVTSGGGFIERSDVTSGGSGGFTERSDVKSEGSGGFTERSDVKSEGSGGFIERSDVKSGGSGGSGGFTLELHKKQKKRYDRMYDFVSKYSESLSKYGEVYTTLKESSWGGYEDSFMDPYEHEYNNWVKMGVKKPPQCCSHLIWVLKDNKDYDEEIQKLETKLKELHETRANGRWSSSS